MKPSDKTRANDFDRRCGRYQMLKSMSLGHGDSLLDVGCGFGEFTPMFTLKFKQVFGLDPSAKYLKEAKKRTDKVTYLRGWGETFRLDQKFDTISMTNLLEHVDNPTILLKNCKRHLNRHGVVIAQVPNSRSITRRLGVLMGLINKTGHISEKERDFFGHKRAYTLRTLKKDFIRSELNIVETGGVIYKPLPNEMLEIICQKQGSEWTEKFLGALYKFGEDRPNECGYIYVVGQ